MLRGWAPSQERNSLTLSDDNIDKLVSLIQESKKEPQIDLLLQPGLDLNQTNRNHVAPLQAAVLKSFERTVKSLLNAGADVNFSYEGHDTPLFNVSNVKIGQELLDRGARLDFHCKPGQDTPLHSAVDSNSLPVVKLFVERGADIEARDSEGRTPLLWAAAQCFDKIVEYLLEQGANPNIVRNTNNISPLFEAVSTNKKQKQLKTVELLLKANANVHHLSEDQNNALKWLVRFGGSVELAQLLLQSGADLHFATERFHETPLSSAVYEGRADLAELFLTAGASPDVRISDTHNDPGRRGKTAREIAMASKKPAIRKLFG
ncbi:MAG: hypothetical protein JWN70_4614 [Planctomycetaceae bacterium]|nr:hypothetical protein [Planctomycetaceae bacterium]